MDIRNSVALVTGANRGIGEQYVKALIEANAKKIYATGRDLDLFSEMAESENDRVELLKLDITRSEEIRAAAEKCRDVDLLINNAGVNFNTPLLGIDGLENARTEIETNYFGTLSMCRAFAPILDHLKSARELVGIAAEDLVERDFGRSAAARCGQNNVAPTGISYPHIIAIKRDAASSTPIISTEIIKSTGAQRGRSACPAGLNNFVIHKFTRPIHIDTSIS